MFEQNKTKNVIVIISCNGDIFYNVPFTIQLDILSLLCSPRLHQTKAKTVFLSNFIIIENNCFLFEHI